MEDSFQKLGDVASGIVAELGFRSGVRIVRPSSREEWIAGKTKTVGASEIAALFGVHSYLTPYELFAIKAGLAAKDFAEAEVEADAIHIPPTERGQLFEDDAFELIARLRPDWQLTPNQIPGGEVFVDAAAGMSSTPDLFAVEPGMTGRAAIQTKTMNDRVFREQWMRDGVIEPPLAVAVQAIADATLADCERAYAAAMVVGFKTSLYLVEVPLHASLMVKARALVKDFWRRVADNDPYPPDFARDGALIARIYGDDDGGEIDLTADAGMVQLLLRREELKTAEAAGLKAEKARKALDAELIFKLGNAARARVAGGKIIEAPTTRREAHMVKASSFRSVKVKEAKSEGKAA